MAITNLTGTEWELKANPTLPAETIVWALEVEFQNDLQLTPLPTSNSLTASQIQISFENSGQAVVSYTAQDGWSWVVAQSTEAPLIKIAGGQDATTQSAIDWITANATQVVDPTVEATPVMTKGVFAYFWSKLKTYLQSIIPNKATDTTLGLIKTNPNDNIDLSTSGQLVVGGRFGQYPNGGMYYPTTIDPTKVGSSTLMMTDGAKGLETGPRTFSILAGAGLTCKSAAAGTTQYRISNTQGNRFACYAGQGGNLAIDQSSAMNGTSKITNIAFANGNPISAYFGPTESNNDIIITVDRTVNPDSATTKLRIYGQTGTGGDQIVIGQGTGSKGSKAIVLGQSSFTGGAQTLAIGNSIIVTANNSVGFGHTQLVNKQFCFSVGQGHDFTNADNGSTAVGIASQLNNDTAFAVGNGVFNGNGNITRSNAFEVLKDGSVVLKSPNGTRYKISVSDDGTITTTPV